MYHNINIYKLSSYITRKHVFIHAYIYPDTSPHCASRPLFPKAQTPRRLKIKYTKNTFITTYYSCYNREQVLKQRHG